MGVVCPCLGGSATCTSPDSASLRWEYLYWALKGPAALCWAAEGGVKGKDERHWVRNLRGKICWFLLCFSSCPSNSYVWSVRSPLTPLNSKRLTSGN